jgi:hypothetical protein
MSGQASLKHLSCSPIRENNGQRMEMMTMPGMEIDRQVF